MNFNLPSCLATMLFKAVIYLLILFGGLIGIFASQGLSIAVWGYRFTEVDFGNHPNLQNPDVWIVLIVMIPLIIVGVSGTLAAICLPLCHVFPKLARFHGRRSLSNVILLRKYALLILHYAEAEIRRVEGSSRDPK